MSKKNKRKIMSVITKKKDRKYNNKILCAQHFIKMGIPYKSLPFIICIACESGN